VNPAGVMGTAVGASGRPGRRRVGAIGESEMRQTSQNEAPAGGYGVAPAGYRLPAATSVGPVTLQVTDLGRSRGYYRDVLGMRELSFGDGAAELGTADGTPLVQLRERPGARPLPPQGRLGLYHFAVLLPDRGALGRFLAHLAELNVYAGMSDHLVSEAVYLRDPDGLGIEVYADRPRTAWRSNGRELVMSTTPLDADAVVAAGGGEPWMGMPAGTRMGHVHLHVGDLDRAAEFYHAALGLDKVVWSYPGALFLSAGGYHHHLGLNTWAAGSPPAAEHEARLLEWVLLVPGATDVDAAAASLAGAGFQVTRAGASLSAADPWGTRLTLRPA